MKNAIKRYWRFWRFGWVAVVAFLVGGLGLNLMGFFVKFMAPEYGAARISWGIGVFLVFGLPYIGWVLEISTGHLERYRRSDNKTNATSA